MAVSDIETIWWVSSVLGLLMVAGATALLRFARTAPALYGLAAILYGNGIQTWILTAMAGTSDAGLGSLLIWLNLITGDLMWLGGYIWLFGFIPAGWNHWMKSWKFRIPAWGMLSATILAFLLIGLPRLVIPTGGHAIDVVPIEGQPDAWMTFAARFFSSVQTVILLTSLGLAIMAVRRAKSNLAKRAAWSYLAAFALVDLYFVGVFGAGALGFEVPIPDDWFQPIIIFIGYIWQPLWIGYAILSARLFDIDLRVKWTISKGAIAAIFIAVFFGVNFFIQAYLEERFGIIGGAIAAALLLLAIQPLRRFGDRFAHVLMPSTVSTPAYEAHRKVEVYKAALQDVLADGELREGERKLLNRLQAQLALDARSVQAIERELDATAGQSSASR